MNREYTVKVEKIVIVTAHNKQEAYEKGMKEIDEIKDKDALIYVERW